MIQGGVGLRQAGKIIVIQKSSVRFPKVGKEGDIATEDISSLITYLLLIINKFLA